MKKRKTVIFTLLTAMLLLSAAISLLLGRYGISLRQCLGIFASLIVNIEPFWTKTQANMLLLVRAPRVIIAVLAGMALSVAGSSYQCIFKNPLAAPDILGASTGAAFGAALAILNGLDSTLITVCAFVASLVCVALVILVSRLCRGERVMGLVLSGIMIGSLFSAATSYLKLIADPNSTLPAITYWMMGSCAGADIDELGFVWIPMLIALVPILALRWKMNILTLGDDEARSMGVNTAAVRGVIIVCATLLTAASVSVCGVIGWVGLVIPHLARRLVGNDCRVLIPASALLGGSFLVIVDDLARALYTTELPLGVLTAFIGAPFFIYLMARKGVNN